MAEGQTDEGAAREWFGAPGSPRPTDKAVLWARLGAAPRESSSPMLARRADGIRPYSHHGVDLPPAKQKKPPRTGGPGRRVSDFGRRGRTQAVMSFRSSATVKSASVAALTSSTVNSGLISVMTRPSLVTSITHISVMILVMQWTAV